MIVRDIQTAAAREFDLVVVGGGIYGASLLQEASLQGLSACLCEAGDLGGGTSWNSLRILHGGLRYLQSMNLGRFNQSVTARRQVAKRFPTLVSPLRCLMPLYGQGLKRLPVMRLALVANDLLGARRNDGLDPSVYLPKGEILDAAATHRAFPRVRTQGLKGAACWSDYFMVSSERILIESVKDACRHGAMALNYTRAEAVLSDNGKARGVRVRDVLTGEAHEIAGRVVVNCTGPRIRDLARSNGGDADRLFRPSLAFNLMLDIELPAEHAMAVAAPDAGAPTLFVVPQGRAVLAGTMHLPRPAETTEAVPTGHEVRGFLEMLNRAIPGLQARPEHIRHVFAGLLPATKAGNAELLKREVVKDHAQDGGLRGFYSISGVKFTTANYVARQVLSGIFPRPGADTQPSPVPLSPATPILTNASHFLSLEEATAAEALRSVIAEEAVLYLDDLVLRRTNWGVGGADLGPIRQRVQRLTGLPSGLE